MEMWGVIFCIFIVVMVVSISTYTKTHRIVDQKESVLLHATFNMVVERVIVKWQFRLVLLHVIEEWEEGLDWWINTLI